MFFRSHHVRKGTRRGTFVSSFVELHGDIIADVVAVFVSVTISISIVVGGIHMALESIVDSMNVVANTIVFLASEDSYVTLISYVKIYIND